MQLKTHVEAERVGDAQARRGRIEEDSGPMGRTDQRGGQQTNGKDGPATAATQAKISEALYTGNPDECLETSGHT